MKVSSIILRCEDVERSKAFWTERVGLPIEGEFPGFVFLDGGPIRIILSAADSVTDDSQTEVVFEVDDIREAYAEMSGREVPFETELRVINSTDDRELLAAHFRDPDGHYGTITAWEESTE